KFTGSDFFIDKNVFGIALDLPNHLRGHEPPHRGMGPDAGAHNHGASATPFLYALIDIGPGDALARRRQPHPRVRSPREPRSTVPGAACTTCVPASSHAVPTIE